MDETWRDTLFQLRGLLTKRTLLSYMYIHKTAVYLKTQVNIYPLIVGDFSVIVSPKHRSSEEKKKLTTEPFNSVYQCILILPDF